MRVYLYVHTYHMNKLYIRGNLCEHNFTVHVHCKVVDTYFCKQNVCTYVCTYTYAYSIYARMYVSICTYMQMTYSILAVEIEYKYENIRKYASMYYTHVHRGLVPILNKNKSEGVGWCEPMILK